MNQNAFLLLSKGLIEDLEEACERLEELREHYTDLLERARSSPTISVSASTPDHPSLFPRAPSAEELLKMF